MRKSIIIFILSLLFVLVISCKNEAEDPGTLALIDISDARSTFLSSSTARSTDKTMLKVTDNGHVEKVKFYNKKKNGDLVESSQIIPTEIRQAGDDYLFIPFRDDIYIVRKSDSAVFNIPQRIGYRHGMDFRNSNHVRWDSNGNLYFLDFYGKLYKVNMESLTVTCETPDSDTVHHFEVDSVGNIIYSGSSNGSFINRVKKTNGGYNNISYKGGNWCFDGWLAADGFVYCIKRRDDLSSDFVINKIVVDENYNLSEVKYGQIDYSPNNTTSEFIISPEGRTIIVDTNPNRIYEVFNPENAPRIIELSELTITSVTAVSCTENYYYIAGLDSDSKAFLIRVNPLDDTYIDILERDTYDVYSFIVSEEHGIEFNALRMNDGKTIIGQVNIDGSELIILDESINDAAIDLVKVN